MGMEAGGGRWVNSPGREWSRQMRDSWGGLPKLKAGAEEAGDVVGRMGRSGLVVWRLLKTVTLTYVAVSAQGEQPFWDSTYQSCCRPNASQHCVQGSNCVLFCGSLMLVDGFFLKIIYFYFVLHWVFVAFRGLSLVAASGGYSLLLLFVSGFLIAGTSLVSEHGI